MRVVRVLHNARAVLAAGIITAAGLAMLYWSYSNQLEAYRAEVLSRGESLLDAVAAGIRAQTRMGRYRDERISAIFEELVRDSDIVGVYLHGPEGNLVAGGGEPFTEPFAPLAGPRWTPERLRLTASVDLVQHGPRGSMRPMGRGRGAAEVEDWTPWRQEPYYISVTLDIETMRHQDRRARFLYGSMGMLLIATGILAALTWRARIRRAGLQVELAMERERAEHHERLTRLGAGLAHETKNPLGLVRGLAQSVLDSPGDASQVRAVARQIIDESDRTVEQINSFLALARPREVQLEPVDLDGFLEEMLPLIEPEASSKGIEVQYEQREVTVEADPRHLRRAVMNLILNALRASSSGGTIEIGAEEEGETVNLYVRDHGEGIPEEDLDKVTEPYFTRFPGGTGLGLAIVSQIAQAHGWRVRIDSKVGEGTRVTLEGLKRGAGSSS